MRHFHVSRKSRCTVVLAYTDTAASLSVRAASEILLRQVESVRCGCLKRWTALRVMAIPFRLHPRGPYRIVWPWPDCPPKSDEPKSSRLAVFLGEAPNRKRLQAPLRVKCESKHSFCCQKFCRQYLVEGTHERLTSFGSEVQWNAKEEEEEEEEDEEEADEEEEEEDEEALR